MQWDRESAVLSRESQFERCYRMRAHSFEKLLVLISARLPNNYRQQITPTLILQATIRYLCGGSHHDIRCNTGVSSASFYGVVWLCCDAIVSCQDPVLSIIFPSTESAIVDAVSQFSALSAHGVINGAVGCVDGWLYGIKAPSKTDTGGLGPRLFFSGHYQDFGVNVQACGDASCRFTYVSVLCTGGTNDLVAFEQSSLSDIIKRLSLGVYVIGDNAYPLSKHLLTPFTANEINTPDKDSYNYHLSQIRIRIEMAFGLLVTKWRVFRKPLEVGFISVPRLIAAAMKLHNFCISERLQLSSGDSVSSAEVKPLTQKSEFGYLPSDLDERAGHNSVLRTVIIEHIASRNAVRPRQNLSRRQQNDDE